MLLSIVIPTLNAGRYLSATLDSVLSQRGDFDLEVIVADGGSRDATLDIVRACHDPRLRIDSRIDRGQADAINRGLALARGDVLAWLNADDLYEPGTLETVAGTFAEQPPAQWLVGGCGIIDAHGRPTRQWITRYKQAHLRRFSRWVLLRENVISQPAVFWRRDLWRRVGGLDARLHWTMDYDLWLRFMALAGPRVIDRTLAWFRLHPSSKTGAVSPRQFLEQYRVACRYFGRDWLSRAVHACHVVKTITAYQILALLGR